jgi:hypothetical protein
MVRTSKATAKTVGLAVNLCLRIAAAPSALAPLGVCQ